MSIDGIGTLIVSIVAMWTMASVVLGVILGFAGYRLRRQVPVARWREQPTRPFGAHRLTLVA